MIRTGFVKDKKGERLSVCFERPSSCEGCKGCAKGLMSKSELLTVFGEAEVGDIVDVEMPEGRVFQASLLAYGL
ncbi:MAG: SoxR reducing system RseC family protein, partial [Clostridia bacterium]|nr:SoxR reducing system RseC family protein [Clostridia bacterium]